MCAPGFQSGDVMTRESSGAVITSIRTPFSYDQSAAVSVAVIPNRIVAKWMESPAFPLDHLNPRKST